VASYHLINGEFLKFPLFIDDTLKTIPLALYERLQGADVAEVRRKNGFVLLWEQDFFFIADRRF